MCGIVGSVGFNDTKGYLVAGLKALDYRGYDSAGIAVLSKTNQIEVFKTVGSVSDLEKTLPKMENSFLGIGHTRWATHGKPSVKNSHPHVSNGQDIVLVHNGVIENYLEIKNHLLSKGYSFYSDTDSEVIANLIKDKYIETQDILKAMKKAMEELKGSYAVCLFSIYDKEHLYLMKNSSPLLIGKGDGFSLVASDATPMIEYTRNFVELDDKQMAIISKDNIQLFDKNGEKIGYKIVTKDLDSCHKDLEGYPHFMLKETEEIEAIVRRLMLNYYDSGSFNFNPELIDEITRADHIIFIACGTSYHASLVGVRYFEHIGKSASAYIASEWAFYPRLPGNKPFVIFISQSGETADSIHCLKIIQQHGIHSLIITNTKGSTLDRGCSYSLLLSAGLEVAVASTKAYVAQVAALALLTNAISVRHKIVRDLQACCSVIQDIKENMKDRIIEMAGALKDEKNIFYLGRGYDYDLSLEASLKLKEVSYIHSEAVAGGELKHGPIALIEKDTPVIVFITDNVTASSMRGNIQEVKARGAKVFVISTEELGEPTDYIVVKNYPCYLSSVAISCLAFYFAYYVSLAKGLNVDKPRNLAKSVTVE